MKKVFKDLQNLYSWSDFYKKNERFADAEKTQKQIIELKNKHNLNGKK